MAISPILLAVHVLRSKVTTLFAPSGTSVVEAQCPSTPCTDMVTSGDNKHLPNMTKHLIGQYVVGRVIPIVCSRSV
jgi:hypothetical protein